MNETNEKKRVPWGGLIVFLICTLPFAVPLCVWLTRGALGLW